MRLPALLFAVTLVLGTTACSSSQAASTSAPRAPTTTAVPVRTMHWTNEGPPLTLLAPYCDPARHCVYPWTERGTLHGDLEGSHVSAGVAALDTTGKHYAVSRTDLFIGTVKGCGSGTIVILGDENSTANGGAGTWEVARGKGTGALAHVTGHGTGTGTADKRGIHSVLTGALDCGR